MRQTHLNRCELEVNKDGVVKVIPFGDIHWGGKTCNVDKVRRMVKYMLKHHIYMVGMGDYLECATKGSVGAGWAEQVGIGQDQYEVVVDMLKPLADAGLILGLYEGNHEMRPLKDVGFKPVVMMCRELGVPYLGYTGFQHWRVGKMSYKVAGTHGYSNARYVHTKMAAAVKFFENKDVDIGLYAHTHGLSSTVLLNEGIDSRNRTRNYSEKHIVLTGSYLEYSGSYAEMLGLPPVKTGSPRITLSGKRHDIHVST